MVHHRNYLRTPDIFYYFMLSMGSMYISQVIGLKSTKTFTCMLNVASMYGKKLNGGGGELNGASKLDLTLEMDATSLHI